MSGNVLKIKIIGSDGNVIPSNQARMILIATLLQSPNIVDDGEQYIIIMGGQVEFDVRTENIKG